MGPQHITSRRWSDAKMVGFDDNCPMERVAKIIPKHQQPAADLAYWLSRPMAERVAAVEILRQQMFNPTDAPDAEPRLQRVCRITQRQGR